MGISSLVMRATLAFQLKIVEASRKNSDSLRSSKIKICADAAVTAARQLHRLKLLGGKGADHALAELLRLRFQLSELEKFLYDIFHNASAFFDVSHFTTPEDNGHLDFVFML